MNEAEQLRQIHEAAQTIRERASATVDETEANARLIQAAPELLAACKLFETAEAAWEADEGSEGTFGEWMDKHGVSAAMRAAIAKAEGRTA